MLQVGEGAGSFLLAASELRESIGHPGHVFPPSITCYWLIKRLGKAILSHAVSPYQIH